MNFLNIAACENSSTLSVIMFIKDVMEVLFIIGPILLIVLCAVDLMKLALGADPSDSKPKSRIVGRFIAAICMFFVPLMVNLLVNNIDNLAETYTICVSNATEENIAFYKELEQAKEEIELQKLESEKNVAKKEREALAKEREKVRVENEKKAEEEKKKEQSESGNKNPIEGDAKTYKDVVWNVNDVTQVSHLTSTQLVSILNSKGGNAKNFVPFASGLITAENKYSVNVFFLMGIEALESGWVTSAISRNCNNLGGVCQSSAHPSNGCGSNSNCSFAYFKTKDEFVDYHASMLHKNYLTPGGSYYHGPTPSGVVTSYCPGCTDWPPSVTSIANSLFNECKKVM